jgi:predicted phosphodiesterase
MNKRTNTTTVNKPSMESKQSSKPLRLHILSDLHLEFRPLTIPKPAADVIILAGDIDVGRNGLEWIRHQFPDQPVVYVLGNHEFYQNSLPELTRTLMQETEGSHVHLLENTVVELHGFTFLGCTLWTSFMVGPDPAAAMRMAEARMVDYRIIRNSIENRVLRATDTARLHRESVSWLKDELRRHDLKRTIVVTHHAPSYQSETPQYRNGPLSSSFCSDLDWLIESSGIPLWIHGHTHYNVDYPMGSTRILANQRGYPGERCEHFNPALVVEV